MNAKGRLVSLYLLLAVALLSPAAGSEQEPEAGVDLDGVRELREQTEADASLTADLITRALGLYDAAIASLETAERTQAEVVRLDKERAGVGRLAEALRADLSEPEEAPRIDIPDDATSEQAETLLARERSRLRAHRAALRDAERLVEERSAARDEASRRLGFGLQEIVANFVSGLILLLERPVRVGDAVTIGNLQGRVSRIHIRATTITLWDRSEMIVPNKEFITTKLVNWTLSDSKRRVDIPLRVTYDADLATVKQTLVEVASRNPDVLDDPPPVALLLEFGEDALKFELRYYVDFGQGLKTRDELHMAVDAAFREKGIAFALPQLNIKVPSGTQPPRPGSS